MMKPPTKPGKNPPGKPPVKRSSSRPATDKESSLLKSSAKSTAVDSNRSTVTVSTEVSFARSMQTQSTMTMMSEVPSVDYRKEYGTIREKLKNTVDENRKLTERLEILQKENETLKEVNKMEKYDQKRFYMLKCQLVKQQKQTSSLNTTLKLMREREVEVMNIIKELETISEKESNEYIKGFCDTKLKRLRDARYRHNYEYSQSVSSMFNPEDPPEEPFVLTNFLLSLETDMISTLNKFRVIASKSADVNVQNLGSVLCDFMQSYAAKCLQNGVLNTETINKMSENMVTLSHFPADNVISLKEKLDPTTQKLQAFNTDSLILSKLSSLDHSITNELFKHHSLLSSFHKIPLPIDKAASKTKSKKNSQLANLAVNPQNYLQLIHKLSEFKANWYRFALSENVQELRSVIADYEAWQGSTRENIDKYLYQPILDMNLVLDQFRNGGFSPSIGIQMLNEYNIYSEKMTAMVQNLLGGGPSKGKANKKRTHDAMEATLQTIFGKLKEYETYLGNFDNLSN